MNLEPWSWATGTPRERADMVRAHLSSPRLTEEHVADLFGLSIEGLLAIKRGCDWDRAYDRLAPSQSR